MSKYHRILAWRGKKIKAEEEDLRGPVTKEDQILIDNMLAKVKVTVCPPGEAYGARDLRRWHGNRAPKDRADDIKRWEGKTIKSGCLTSDEIEQARSPAGGWTRATLANWGVPWPPPKGWKYALENGKRIPCRKLSPRTKRKITVTVKKAYDGEKPPWE